MHILMTSKGFIETAPTKTLIALVMKTTYQKEGQLLTLEAECMYVITGKFSSWPLNKKVYRCTCTLLKNMKKQVKYNSQMYTHL